MSGVATWFEYRCVECVHNGEEEFVMLVPDDGTDVPDACPRCCSLRSLMFAGSREVSTTRAPVVAVT